MFTEKFPNNKLLRVLQNHTTQHTDQNWLHSKIGLDKGMNAKEASDFCHHSTVRQCTSSYKIFNHFIKTYLHRIPVIAVGALRYSFVHRHSFQHQLWMPLKILGVVLGNLDQVLDGVSRDGLEQ